MKITTSILIFLFSVLLGLSLFLNLKQYMRTKADAARIALLASRQTPQHAPVVTRYIHDSIEHLVIKEVVVATEEDKGSAVGTGYLDTLMQSLKVAEKQIDQVTKINADLRAENIVLKKSTDSKTFGYKDQWLSLDYYPDSNKLNLSYDVTLSTARYWKRKWFLAPRQYYVDIFSDDPRIKIGNIKRYTVAEPKAKKFGIGLHAGYSYNPFKNRWHPSFGLGLNYNLIRF